MKFIDITGRRFGRLLVIACRHQGDAKRVLCRCDCGRDFVVLKTSLTGSRANTRSCGCLRRETTVRRFRTHGARKTSEYEVWCQMIKRCENPRGRSYKNYGARGIRVCEHWRASFADFLADMGRRPSPMHSIERIDNSLGYEPSNCRWATKAEQNANTRKNRLLTFQGETLHMAEWARRLSMRPALIVNRLSMGWSVEETLSRPVRPNVLVTFNGETLNASQWAKRLGIAEQTMKYRLKRWPIEHALQTPRGGARNPET